MFSNILFSALNVQEIKSNPTSRRSDETLFQNSLLTRKRNERTRRSTRLWDFYINKRKNMQKQATNEEKYLDEEMREEKLHLNF